MRTKKVKEETNDVRGVERKREVRERDELTNEKRSEEDVDSGVVEKKKEKKMC